MTIPEEKQCPTCKEVKPASEFFRDKSRKDGLKYYCKPCSTKSIEPKYKKRSFSAYKKQCRICKRSLSASSFVYSNTHEDGLELQCRTCRSWRSRSTTPSVDESLAYETQIDNIIQAATMKLLSTYVDEGSRWEVINDHRSEFEQLCVLGFQHTDLGGKWKMPIWIHSSSIP